MKKLDSRGMTLVEIVVAFAVIMIGGLMILSSFLTAFNLMNAGADIQSSTVEAYEQAETLTGSLTPGTVEFSVSGETWEVSGNYAEGSHGDSPKVSLYSFSPFAW